MRLVIVALLALAPLLAGAQGFAESADPSVVVTADVDRFWEAFDQVAAEPDSAAQIRLIDSLFIQSTACLSNRGRPVFRR